MKRLLAAIRRRRLVLSGVAAVALLAGIAGATPGAFGAYSAKITNGTDTAASAQYFTCLGALSATTTSVTKSNVLFQWPLADATNATSASDISGNNRSGTYNGTVTADSSTPIACPRDGGSAMRFNGTSTFADYATSQANPQTFSIEVYFQTTVKQGVLIGFGSSAGTGSGSYDRHLYINTDGDVVFGVNSTALVSPTVVTDGNWHHVAGTFTSGSMNLYLDGKLVASSTSAGAAQNFTGYWHVGYNSIGGWAKAPSSGYFNGRMRGACVYNVVLSASDIQNHAAADQN